ncbi:hypothetical protein ABBQ38_005923 [Trebouxia sp. C0009 RCD-2024]
MAAEVKTEPTSLSSPALDTEHPIKQEPTTSESAQPPAGLPAETDPAAASSPAAAPAPGPGSEGRKVSTADIQLVQNLIEKCLQMYLSQREVVSALHQQAKIEPGFTQLVWQKLEEQNPDFFRAYFTRLKLKDQINLFNHLLEQQVNVVQRMQRGWMQPPGMMGQPRPGMPMQPLGMQPAMPMQSQFPAGPQVKHEHDGLGSIAHLESSAEFDASAHLGGDLTLPSDFGLLSSPTLDDGTAQAMPTDFAGPFGFPSPGRVQNGFPMGDEQWGPNGFPRNLSLSDLSLDQLGVDTDHNALALWNAEGHHELPAMPKNMSFSELPQLDYELDK